MKVFISSTIAGMQQLRDAADRGIRALGYAPTRSETYGATPESPQTICLAGVRAADAVVLILGEHYGHAQASGLSATHEEYREAKERLDVLVFLQSDVSFDAAQAAFVKEIQDWSRGHFTETFDHAEDLQLRVTRRLHELAMSRVSGTINAEELVARADELVRQDSHNNYDPVLCLAVVPGPTQSVLRPQDLEDPGLRVAMQQEAQFGASALFERLEGISESISGDVLLLAQGARTISVSETGRIRIDVSAAPADGDAHLVLIEEELADRLERSVRYSGWLLERIDSVHRLSDVALVAGLRNCQYRAWRTMAEQQRSPNSVTMSNLGGFGAVQLSPPVRKRAALLQDSRGITAALLTKLRRIVKDMR